MPDDPSIADDSRHLDALQKAREVRKSEFQDATVRLTRVRITALIASTALLGVVLFQDFRTPPWPLLSALHSELRAKISAIPSLSVLQYRDFKAAAATQATRSCTSQTVLSLVRGRRLTQPAEFDQMGKVIENVSPLLGINPTEIKYLLAIVPDLSAHADKPLGELKKIYHAPLIRHGGGSDTLYGVWLVQLIGQPEISKGILKPMPKGGMAFAASDSTLTKDVLKLMNERIHALTKNLDLKCWADAGDLIDDGTWRFGSWENLTSDDAIKWNRILSPIPASYGFADTQYEDKAFHDAFEAVGKIVKAGMDEDLNRVQPLPIYPGSIALPKELILMAAPPILIVVLGLIRLLKGNKRLAYRRVTALDDLLVAASPFSRLYVAEDLAAEKPLWRLRPADWASVLANHPDQLTEGVLSGALWLCSLVLFLKWVHVLFVERAHFYARWGIAIVISTGILAAFTYIATRIIVRIVDKME
jgi:hypothetical protein